MSLMAARNSNECLLIIFDFDGVLADSKEAYALQMQETIEFFTQKKLSDDAFKGRGGNTDQGAECYRKNAEAELKYISQYKLFHRCHY